MDREINSDVYDRLLKARCLHVRIRVTANATAASKTHKAEFPAVMKLKTTGKDDVTGSDAAASTDMGTETDASGNIGVLLLASELGTVAKVINASVAQRDGGTWTASLVDTGTTVDGLTAAGNIAINIDSNQSLATTDADCYLTVDYLRR